MDRGSSKHGPRLDDEMERETLGITEGYGGGRVEEFRDTEPPGEDEPNVSWVPDEGGEETEHDASAPTGMTPDDRERRSELGRYLRRSVFPASGAALVAEASANNAPDAVRDELRRLPETVTYRNVAEVYAAIVGEAESDLEERF
jgi:Protein of unknown function (DUF2795)